MISYDIIATVKNYDFVCTAFPCHTMQSHAIRFSSTSSVNSLKERGEERAREKVDVVVVSDPSVSLVSTSSMRRTERERNSEELCVHAVVLCSWRLASQISEPYLFHAGLQPVGGSPYVYEQMSVLK